MGEARFASQVVAVRRSRRKISRFFVRATLAAAVGPVIVAMLSELIAAWFDIPSFGFAVDLWIYAWLCGAPAACLLALVTGAPRRQGATHVEAGEDALTLLGDGHGRTIRRDRIAGAIVVAGHHHEAEITLDDGDVIHVEVATSDAARALVAALGFDAAARRTAVQLGAEHAALSAGCWGVVMGALITALSTCGVTAAAASFYSLQRYAGYLLGLVFVATSLFVARLLSPKRVVVGNDGVLAEGSFGTRFVKLSSIMDVATTPQGVVLTLREGEPVRRVTLTSEKGEQAAAVRQRIAEAMAHAARAGEEATSELVARGGRPLGAWRDALRKLVTGGGYRGESVSADALLRAAENADAPVEQRIGAAIAIGLGADDDAKRRLRVAVDGIANQKIRVAMERAADGAEDEAAIEEAIAAEKKAATRG